MLVEINLKLFNYNKCISKNVCNHIFFFFSVVKEKKNCIGFCLRTKYNTNVRAKHNLVSVFSNMFLFHSEEPHQPESFKQKTQPLNFE